MNKKIVIGIIIIILAIIFGLWISGVIPKQIARIAAEHYLKNKFPEKKYTYVNIEWNRYQGDYGITFKDESGKTVSFIMSNKYFPIYPGQGTFPLEYSYKIEHKGIKSIDDFYNHSITAEYKDIRSLPQDYSKEQAQKDNCFVVFGAKVYNDNLYNEFMEKYNKKENAFIRVVQSTIEGDIIITDVLYEAKNNKIHLIEDYTRDNFAKQEDRTIQYKTYEKTGVWNYQNSRYWVVYNGELPDGTKAEYSINSEELLIIAKIN